MHTTCYLIFAFLMQVLQRMRGPRLHGLADVGTSAHMQCTNKSKLRNRRLFCILVVFLPTSILLFFLLFKAPSSSSHHAAHPTLHLPCNTAKVQHRLSVNIQLFTPLPPCAQSPKAVREHAKIRLRLVFFSFRDTGPAVQKK